jgi:hypothetical protein
MKIKTLKTERRQCNTMNARAPYNLKIRNMRKEGVSK